MVHKRQLCFVIVVLALTAVAAAESTLKGTVRDSHGTAIPDTAVALWLEDKVVQQATTDEAGKFRFQRLAAGDYVLKVEASGAYAAEYKVSIRSGRPATLNIVLNSTSEHKP